MQREERLRAAGLDESTARRVVEVLDGSDDPARDALDYPLLGAALCAAGDPDLLPVALPPLLRAAAGDDLPPLARGVARHLRALCAWRVDGDLLAATEHLNRSLEILETVGDPAATAYSGRVLDSYGQLLHHQGLLRDARRAFERALERKTRGADEPGIALTRGNLGRLCMALGDFASATRHLQDDLAHVESATPSATRLRSILHTQIAECAIGVDDLDRARAALEQALALATDPIGTAFAKLHLARTELRGGDAGTAEDHLQAVGALALDALPELRGLAAQVRAQVRRAEDDLDAALEHFEIARTSFAAAPRVTPVEHAELLEAYACAAEDNGETQRAADLLREALRGLDATTAEHMRRRINDHLERLDHNAWMLYNTGRFVGHGHIDALLDEVGQEDFRGHQAEAAVLFGDLRRFTTLAESLDPETLVSVLNRYFGHMTRCVEHCGGRVDKFIGDAVMAVFQPDDGRAHHAARAARAALFMQAELKRLNRFLPEGVPALASGIGVHSGPLVAGIIGSPQKRSFTVLGDTVNTASRLEGMSKIVNAPVLVSRAVADAFDDETRTRLLPLGRYRPRGRVGAIEVFAVGEPEPNATLQTEATDALRRFHDRAFEDAAQRFEQLREARGGQSGDKGYALHAAAAHQFIRTPPPPDWDGAIVLTEK